jgi:hypothetical protein
MTTCPKCKTQLGNVPGIGMCCLNRECDIIDNIKNWDQPKPSLYNKKNYTSEIYELGPDNDLIIKLPDELIEELQWFDGDEIIWIDNNDGSFTVKKTNE